MGLAHGLLGLLVGESRQNPQFSEVLTYRQDCIGRGPCITLECLGPERDSLKSVKSFENKSFI